VLVATQRKIATAFAIAAGISIVIGVVSYSSVSRLSDDAAAVAHSQEIIGALQTVLSTATDAETAARRYTITGSDTFLQPYNEAVRDIDTRVARLRTLTTDNASQQRRLEALGALVEQRMGISAEHIAARRAREFESVRGLIARGGGQQVHEAIRGIVDEMADGERALLTERQTRTEQSSRTAIQVIFAGSALALGVVLAALVLITRDFAGARRAQVALREANAMLELRVSERTAELTRVNEHPINASRELRLLVGQAPLAMAMFDRDMRYIATSRRWVSDYGRGRGALAGLSYYELHPDIPQRWTEVHRRGLAGEFIEHDEDIWVRADGSKHWLRWAVGPWRNAQGDIGGITIFAEDITQRKDAEERLRLADAVFRNTQEGIVVTDLSANIVAVNPAFSAITEYSQAELVGQHMRLLRSGRQDTAFYQSMWESIRATGAWQGEIWDRRKSGEIYQQWVQINSVRDVAGDPTCYVGVFTDISRMHHAQSHLEYLAHHDALTGLPNRSLLYSRLRHTIDRARRDSTLCAVLLLDLDGFKAVNDTLGHEAGDRLLQLAGSRLSQRLRDTDTLARLGGDEFVVVLDHLSVAGDAGRMAQALIEQLSTPFQLAKGKQISISGSGGISLFPANGDDAESLIRRADAALYRAKAAGRGAWRFAFSER
jgi:diguanylate cyclase (GGDEF)-like protein/PAS domain S-box-containing protein